MSNMWNLTATDSVQTKRRHNVENQIFDFTDGTHYECVTMDICPVENMVVKLLHVIVVTLGDPSNSQCWEAVTFRSNFSNLWQVTAVTG